MRVTSTKDKARNVRTGSPKSPSKLTHHNAQTHNRRGVHKPVGRILRYQANYPKTRRNDRKCVCVVAVLIQPLNVAHINIQFQKIAPLVDHNRVGRIVSNLVASAVESELS